MRRAIPETPYFTGAPGPLEVQVAAVCTSSAAVSK